MGASTQRVWPSRPRSQGCSAEKRPTSSPRASTADTGREDLDRHRTRVGFIASLTSAAVEVPVPPDIPDVCVRLLQRLVASHLFRCPSH